MKNIQGKTALITGGATGIGFGIAKAFAAAGIKVVIASRNASSLRDAQAQLVSAIPKADVYALALDITDREAMRRAADEFEARFGKLHILCNNAGVNLLGSMDQATYADWDWVLGVNLGGVINGIVSFLPQMKAHGEGGHIINVASMSSFIAGPGAGVYTTSKFAVRGLTESLRLAVAPFGIGVSMVCPGLTQSVIYKSPLSRPEPRGGTGFPPDPDLMKRLETLHAVGMDPEEIGRKTLQALRENRFYVFSHPEFRDEVRELHRRVEAEFTDEPADARRLEVEARRRQMNAAAEEAVARLPE